MFIDKSTVVFMIAVTVLSWLGSAVFICICTYVIEYGGVVVIEVDKPCPHEFRLDKLPAWLDPERKVKC